jgi:hypothetical protein
MNKISFKCIYDDTLMKSAISGWVESMTGIKRVQLQDFRSIHEVKPIYETLYPLTSNCYLSPKEIMIKVPSPAFTPTKATHVLHGAQLKY